MKKNITISNYPYAKKAFGEKDKALSKVPVFKLVVEAIAFI